MLLTTTFLSGPGTALGLGGVALAPEPAPPAAVATAPVTARHRDRGVLRLMKIALAATGQFDQVLTTGDPAQAGASADAARFASFEITSFKETDDWDDDGATPQLRTVHFTLYVIVRNDDPDTRDDECDRLVQVAHNALDGQSFGGATLPNLTRISAGKYKPVSGMERRCEAAGVFTYLIDDYGSHNTDTL